MAYRQKRCSNSFIFFLYRMSNKVVFIYKICKEDLSDKELIDVIKGISVLVKSTHKTLHPGDPDILMRIKPPQRGSFENVITFFYDVSEGVVATIPALNFTNIIYTLATLGLIKKDTGVGLIQFLALIKGDFQNLIRDENGSFEKFKDEQGSVSNIPEKIKSILNANFNFNLNINVGKNNTVQNICNPMQPISEGVKAEGFLEGNPASKIEITNKEKASSKKFVREIKKIKSPNLETENVSEKFLHPTFGSYIGDSDKLYTFKLQGSGGSSLKAHILDDNFLREIREGKKVMTSRTVLKVSLKENQYFEKGILKVKYEILEIIDDYEIPESSEKQSLF